LSDFFLFLTLNPHVLHLPHVSVLLVSVTCFHFPFLKTVLYSTQTLMFSLQVALL
jgi:hypothetical protein